MNVTFGEWLRWIVARRKIERAELARRLECSQSTISNLFRRDTPEGVSDVTLSLLAELLDISEPELMVKWKDGLPPRQNPAKAGKSKGKAK